MCTAIAWNNNGLLFGRTMDISYHFNEQVIITPKEYGIKFKEEKKLYKHYAMIGIGTIIEGYPLYAEAMNEKGLCVAGLNFKGYAYYEKEVIKGKKNIAPYELILYILGLCSSVEEAIQYVKETVLVEIPFKEGIPLSYLHFMFSDDKQNVVVEYTRLGLKIYDNPLGVMCNNPTFDYHLLNINNYLSCNEYENNNKMTRDNLLKSFGIGSGGFGLPGDSSSPSRFVKASFVKSKAAKGKNSVIHFFHLLDSVKIAKGTIKNTSEEMEYTTYMSCIDTVNKILYYKTYESNTIVGVKLSEEYIVKDKLKCFDLHSEPNILIVNE